MAPVADRDTTSKMLSKSCKACILHLQEVTVNWVCIGRASTTNLPSDSFHASCKAIAGHLKGPLEISHQASTNNKTNCYLGWGDGVLTQDIRADRRVLVYRGYWGIGRGVGGYRRYSRCSELQKNVYDHFSNPCTLRSSIINGGVNNFPTRSPHPLCQAVEGQPKTPTFLRPADCVFPRFALTA
jgi:hypothetical protein